MSLNLLGLFIRATRHSTLCFFKALELRTIKMGRGSHVCPCAHKETEKAG